MMFNCANADKRSVNKYWPVKKVNLY